MFIAMITFECRDTGNVKLERLVYHGSGSKYGPHDGENEGAPRMSSIPCPCLKSRQIDEQGKGMPRGT